ncbi:PEP-CTERM sorting domain-containing protein [Cyanobacteria bacterium FACHB-472]|nr:PEP-CTERM sorting domain-containing protein [Cyanobacteria bacterium FACHB-472]
MAPLSVVKNLSMAVSGAAFIVIGTLGNPAIAEVITFQGADPVQTSTGGRRPNSDAVAAKFDTAAGGLGKINLIDFESAPLGNFSSLIVAPGVIATLTNTGSEVYAGITSGSPFSRLGFNTTAGGEQFLRVVPTFSISTATVNFSFANPIQAFGAYFTDLETGFFGSLNVLFNDGTSQVLSIIGNIGGGSQFFGFTDAGQSIASVSLQVNNFNSDRRDIFGIDDIRYVATSESVPEPTSVLGLFSFGTLALLLKRNKKHRA